MAWPPPSWYDPACVVNPACECDTPAACTAYPFPSIIGANGDILASGEGRLQVLAFMNYDPQNWIGLYSINTYNDNINYNSLVPVANGEVIGTFTLRRDTYFYLLYSVNGVKTKQLIGSGGSVTSGVCLSNFGSYTPQVTSITYHGSAFDTSACYANAKYMTGTWIETVMGTSEFVNRKVFVVKLEDGTTSTNEVTDELVGTRLYDKTLLAAIGILKDVTI